MTLKAPDPGWIPFIKLVTACVVGVMLVIFMTLMGRGLALHDVDSLKSPGLLEIVGALTVGLGMFFKWLWDTVVVPKMDEANKPVASPQEKADN